MVAPNEEKRFLSLCSEIENQRYETLSDTLEATILQVITDLQYEIENCRLPSKTITEKINEDIPEKFHRAQRTVTQACKRMGFKTLRSHGQTYLEIDPKLFLQLSARYIKKSAPSAPSAQTSEINKDSGYACGFTSGTNKFPSAPGGAEGAEGEKTKKEVHPISNCNDCKRAQGAEGALNQKVYAGKCENGKLYNDQGQIFNDQRGMWIDPT
ncbi:MAG: hypothetical protein SRB2_02219 [Desulfobacteraceae bacterium Eth-SRB2]|nr:MAG: hypothetical protein SRB2_02219 [Desulfobacteraceae bacterium Eth-SRB2]